MTSRARWLVVAAVTLLASAFVLPLWRVDLLAPQYPEGLGMLIRIDGVEGIKEHDLHSINNLNHYIGMKAIDPDAIPELRWMPWILGALVLGGLGVAASGRRATLYAWTAALGLLLGVGFWDYWRWGYDYGHDIDRAHAIIKIPDMTYSPPLIGSKKLLNFTATSWPASGGIGMGLAAGLAVAAVFLTACAPAGPRSLRPGEDACDYCRMEITDPRFAAQVVTSTGKQVLFDSVECMASYVRTASPGTVRETWVGDAQATRGVRWVRASAAGYVVGGALQAPMGQPVAFGSPAAATAAAARQGGTTVSWDAIIADSAGIASPAGH
ncbi:MAG TPA: nitrous oxide reductase accessory protein NosL [Gemmatimonadaceae bacterium]|nr:nitrous oxide reductase accessory protein NosL [Gemmatimonadaceae bacterium]